MQVPAAAAAAAASGMMTAAQASGYGSQMDQLLSVATKSVPIPRLDDPFTPTEPLHPIIRFATRQDRKTHMIVQTLAVALAPGDCRVLSGQTRELQGPPSFPYIPGGDCCGIVVETQQNETYFMKGDIVAARFTVAPRDAMGEYARVSTSVCEKVVNSIITDHQISPEAAAALASASPAVALCETIRPGEKVLILGAGGGVGSHLCQLVRMQGASYICGVSETPERLLEAPLSCDDAIDYTKENVYESKKYQAEPFDTIIDLACGGWPALVRHSRQKMPSIVKSANQGGRYLTPTSDTPTFEGHGILPLLGMFLIKPLWRYLWSRVLTRHRLPTFTNVNGLPDTRDILTKTFRLANEGKLQAVIDGPYPLTTEGVRNAFSRLQSRHAKGKVVVTVADRPSTTSSSASS